VGNQVFIQFTFRGKVYAAKLIRHVSNRHAEIRIFLPEEEKGRRWYSGAPSSPTPKEGHWNLIPDEVKDVRHTQKS
jgi:hypothetical protein